jgi:capsular exopolysaccharide synthesis family protein
MELRDYLRVLRAHWVAIVVLTLVGAGAAFAWTLTQTKIYTADASGYVTPYRAGNEEGTGVAFAADNLAKSKVLSFVKIGAWRTVAEHAIDDLGLDTTPEALVRRVSVSNPTNTVVIDVQAEATTAAAARDLAEAWIRGMALEIDKLETGGGDVDPTVTLVAAESAQLPASPSSPNVRLAIALGALIGLALGIGYAVLRYVLDRRLRSPDAVERETGLAVVGTIPDEKSFSSGKRLIPFDGANSSGSENAHLFAVSESLRELRTNIRFMDVDSPPRVIVVTSPLPGDGKSTTAANLAITIAANGEQVVLIDGDLRRPMVATIFGLVEGAGLTDVLSDRATLDDVAQPVGELGTLRVVGAGRVPPNPSEVLGSARMRELLLSLRGTATVIIDAPPLIPVTDAAVLANSADGAIVVGTVGKTTYEVLRKALGNLERSNARALGIVLNRMPRKKGSSAYYGYQYTGDYYRAAEPEALPRDEGPAPGPRRTPASVPDTAPIARVVETSAPADAATPALRRRRRESNSLTP